MKQEKAQAPEPPKPNYALIERLLYQQVEKPKNTILTKIINVFENRYRINVYVQVEENGYTKQKIGASYFARLNQDKLDIMKDLQNANSLGL